MNDKKLLKDIDADDLKRRGRVTHFTLHESGEWFIALPSQNWQDRGFAFKFQNGDIWDPVVGWRK